MKWNLKRLQFYTFCGQSSTGSYPTKAIWAFGPTDIWITSGSEITHYDGNNQSSTACIPVSVYKLWGTSSSDLYVVGAIGGIAHFNGTSWTKIESGTSLDIQDIYGAYNSVTSQWEVIAVAGNAGSSYDRKILQIKGTNISTLSDNPISLSLNGVWFVPNQRYYVVGDGIYEKSNLSDTSWIVHQLDITHYYTTQVKGNSTNDVFIIGAFGEFLHWNGKSWLSYQSVTGLSNGAYGSMAIRNNLVIAVGMDSPRAVVTIGRR